MGLLTAPEGEVGVPPLLLWRVVGRQPQVREEHEQGGADADHPEPGQVPRTPLGFEDEPQARQAGPQRHEEHGGEFAEEGRPEGQPAP